MRMPPDNPKNVFGKAEFCRLVDEATAFTAETLAPPILNLGQLSKAITTPMNPKV